MKRASVAAVLLLAGCASATTTGTVSESVELITPTGAVHGTLLVPPHGPEPIPVAVVVAGSGPTDGDGNSPLLPGPNNSLRMLAETLASNGIASLRYDKRGVGASAASGVSEADLRFDFYVDDVASWIAQLRRDRRFSKVVVIGHSEGSLIGMIAARMADADGFVSIAGAGRSAPSIIREQLKPQLPKELWDESERILTALLAGQTADNVPPALSALYRPSVQPYLVSWFKRDPVAEIAQLTVPVLIAHGTSDIQTTVADAEALHRAAKSSELAIIEGMNHVLKTVGSGRDKQMASYSDPSLPLNEELGRRIVSFVRKL
jgi:uncharacterized protein